MATMTDQRSIPADPSQTLKVIGAGYSRTGTVSFTMALEILLKGRVCHCGTASMVREPAWMKSWIAISSADPIKERPFIKDTLRSMFAGYVGITDNPGVMFVEEFCELYPDALVIMTTRDPERWWGSFKEVAETMTLWWLELIFLPLPTLRYFGQWMKALKIRHEYIYGENAVSKVGMAHLQGHTEYVKRVVPAERLFFFDVKDGWEPLCKILDCPVPDQPFPHENDKESIQAYIEGLIKEAIMGWLKIFAVGGILASAGWWVYKST